MKDRMIAGIRTNRGSGVDRNNLTKGFQAGWDLSTPEEACIAAKCP